MRILTWLVASAIAGAAIGGYEVFLRRRGIAPSVTDDPELWSVIRSQAGGDRRTLALCGASRIQLGFSTEEAARIEPSIRTLQLAVDGTNAVATLRDLAEDPTFVGTALLSTLSSGFSPETFDDQAPWVRRRAQGFSFDAALNRRWRAALQERAAVLAPEAELRRVIRRMLDRGDLPEQSTILAADRSRSAEYTGLDLESYAVWRLERDRAGLVSSPKGAAFDRWLLGVDAVEAMTSKIKGRGGRVVIFHDLVTGEYGRVYREAYPRAAYWDQAASRSSAIFIHADDEPEIARLVCPDGSHLNRSDMPAFTRALLAALRRRGALP